MQGKQAKIVSPTQERAIVGYLDTTRYPARDRVMFLLSMKAGLRAKEIASLTWAMVTDAAGRCPRRSTSRTVRVRGRPAVAPFRCRRCLCRADDVAVVAQRRSGTRSARDFL